jgi:outer membrane murein-binding lipoprotein Lpp/DNA-directed RNA polymerase subunit N (RpoN/RPB10)
MKSQRMVISAIVLSFLITAGTIGIIRTANAATVSVSERNAQHRSISGNFKNRKTMRQAFQEIRNALESNDYDLWASLVSARPHDPAMVTPDIFQKLREAHLLRQQGNEEEAQKIMNELGIQKFGSRKNARTLFLAARKAIDSHDYQSWRTLISQ